jgi:hypothetical protein
MGTRVGSAAIVMSGLGYRQKLDVLQSFLRIINLTDDQKEAIGHWYS